MTASVYHLPVSHPPATPRELQLSIWASFLHLPSADLKAASEAADVPVFAEIADWQEAHGPAAASYLTELASPWPT